MGGDGGEEEGLTRTGPANRPRSARPPETVRDSRDARRTAHNPEVEGSNPSPATKARGPFSNRERAFCLWFVHGRPLKQRLRSCGRLVRDPFGSIAYLVQS